MSNCMLNELQCARILVAVLGANFGFEIDGYRASAKMDYAGRRMLIKAPLFDGIVDGNAFTAELNFDELQLHIDDVKTILAERLQSQVFTLWAAA